jgi:hypothetical protein
VTAGVSDTDLRGYTHSGYAESLAEFGSPRLLRRSGGWVIEREIGSDSGKDAIGCYPLFCCKDWSALSTDIDELTTDLISLVLVADPFGDFAADDLRRCFSDRFVPLKTHFVADLRRPIRNLVSPHHRYYAVRALRQLEIERCDAPGRYLDEWVKLYAALVERHRLTGIKAFSRQAFAKQLAVPGIVMLRAIHRGETVAAHLWYRQGEVIHSHLAASNAQGYELMASYALHWFALETFAEEARWLNFGGGSGLSENASDGLTMFKKGWASETRTAFLCGRIFDREKYRRLLLARSPADDSFFPGYRAGEFA